MDLQSIALTALELLSPLVVAGLGWVAARLAALISANVSNTYLRGVLQRLDDAVFTTVRDLEQTVVGQIKDLRADGSLDANDRKRIKDTAVGRVKGLLGPAGVALIAKVLGLEPVRVDALISSKIEAAVHDLRRSSVPANSLNSKPH